MTKGPSPRPRGARAPLQGATPDPPGLVAVLSLAAWAALLLLAPPGPPGLWAFNGFRSLPATARAALLAAAALSGLLTLLRVRGRAVWLFVAVAVALTLAFPLRERIHFLGDTDMRLRTMEGVLPGSALDLRQWMSGVHASPLDLAVDLIVPIQLVHAGMPVEDAVSWVSLVLALAYFAGLAWLAARLGAAPENRLGLFLALSLAGTLEAFAGYAEVAGLVLALVAWWWVVVLDPIDSPRRAAAVAALWLGVVLAHRIGVVLLVTMLWRALGPALPGDQPAARRLLLALTAAAATVAAAVLLATGVLLQVGIDAWRLTEAVTGAHGIHAFAPGSFFAPAALVAPLALLAPAFAGRGGLAQFGRDPRAWLLASAVLPLLPVGWLSLMAANGLGPHRDWDLLAALGLTLTIAAGTLLAQLPAGRLRGALAACAPLLALQAGAWVAVNAHEAVAVPRALALAASPSALSVLQRSTLHFYLGQRALDMGDRVLAARYYEVAFDLDPDLNKGVLAAETWMLAGDAGRARRMLDRARATGLPDSAMRELARGLDSLIVARGGPVSVTPQGWGRLKEHHR